MSIAYCTECGWYRTADGAETTDLDRAMIDHYVETGHGPIERGDADDVLAGPEADPELPAGTSRVERDCEYDCT